jgi:hypothetical protein
MEAAFSKLCGKRPSLDFSPACRLNHDLNLRDSRSPHLSKLRRCGETANLVGAIWTSLSQTPTSATDPGCAAWTSCNALAHAGRSGRRVVSGFKSPPHLQRTMPRRPRQWRKVADHLRPKLPKLAGFLEEAETDMLAYMTFPPQHRTKLHSTNRSNASTTRSSDGPRWSASSPMRTLSFAS